jgi:ketosteroid isomerase-like protein
VSSDAVAVVARFFELVVRGDQAAWGLWADDVVSVSPPEWPEAGQVRGVEAVRETFRGWNTAFGPGWAKGIRVEDITETSDGRVLVELVFDLEGESSGVPILEPAAALYTVEEGKIVKAEHFMHRADARSSAGLD